MMSATEKDVERTSATGERAVEEGRPYMKSKCLKFGCFIVVVIMMVYVCHRLTVVYEASSGFHYELQSRLKSGVTVEHGDRYIDDVLNDRLQKWRSAHVKDLVIEFFRDKYPNMPVPEEELRREVAQAKLGLGRNGSRVFQIVVRSCLPEVCADLANAYVEAISAYTDEENRGRNERAVAQIHEDVWHKQRGVERIRHKLSELSGNAGNAAAMVEVEAQLNKEVALLEKLRKLEAQYRKLSEEDNMSVVFAWRAVVSKRLVFQ